MIMYRILRSAALAALLLLANTARVTVIPPPTYAASSGDIVFVDRAHLSTPAPKFPTERGPAGEFGMGLDKFAPGSRLMIRHADGSLTVLVDGSQPSPATDNLIDVMSPDVSFDGSTIVFAGAMTINDMSPSYGWRLYEINVDGTGFHALNIPGRTFSTVPDNNPNHYDFGNQAFYGWWNDIFPAFLADGRIAFSSTRSPSDSHYDGRHTYNLYVVNGDGSNPHRISNERASLLNPTPLPDGHILVTRWWNQFNQPSNLDIYQRIDNKPYSYTLPDGTTLFPLPPGKDDVPDTGQLPDGFGIRNAPNTWHLMQIDPDGGHFSRFAFTPFGSQQLNNDSGSDQYTGAQPAVVISGTQTLVAFTSQGDRTMVHTTLNTGIRIAYPGVSMLYANNTDAIAGLTLTKYNQGIMVPPFAMHPWGNATGTILFSQVITYTPAISVTSTYTDPLTGITSTVQGSNLQYKLYTMNVDGSNKTLLSTKIGWDDAMEAKPIVPRVGWTAIPDTYTSVAQDDPTLWNVPNNLPQYVFGQLGPGQIQTATIHNPNIYANPPLTLPYINNSPPPGSVALAQVYIDAGQFTGVMCTGKPNPCDTFLPDEQLHAVLFTQAPVSLRGEFTATIPADVPAFVMLRDAQGRAVNGWNRGYISIAQGNAWARPGQTVTCVGCHFGHVSGSVDPVMGDALQGLTNLSPYATASASSFYTNTNGPAQIDDRRGWVPVPPGAPGGPYEDTTQGWISQKGLSVGQWVSLKWAAPMTVTKIRLVGPPPVGGDRGQFGKSGTPYYVTSGTLTFSLGGLPVAYPISVGIVEPLTNGGTLVTLPLPITLDTVTFTIDSIQGDWSKSPVAALNEMEVIGMAAPASPPPGSTATPTPPATATPTDTPTPTDTGTPTFTSTPKPTRTRGPSPTPTP